MQQMQLGKLNAIVFCIIDCLFYLYTYMLCLLRMRYYHNHPYQLATISVYLEEPKPLQGSPPWERSNRTTKDFSTGV
jgi:hypothetical protein